MGAAVLLAQQEQPGAGGFWGFLGHGNVGRGHFSAAAQATRPDLLPSLKAESNSAALALPRVL